MKNLLKVAGIVSVVAVVAFVGISVAYAQGPGGRNGHGPREGGMGLMAVDPELMHARLADALDMSVEEFEAAIADGQTLYTLAQEKGVDFADLREVMEEAHADALAQAVADGRISQEQADWMLSRSPRAGAFGQGAHGPMGMGGFGGDCPREATR